MNLSLFLLAAPESLRVSTVWQALPLSGVSFVRGTKVKFCLTLSLGLIIGSFPFPCLRSFFYLRQAFVPLLNFQTVFRAEDKKRIVPIALKGFSPWEPQRQEAKYSNSFWKNKYRLSAEHERGFINQEPTSNSVRLTQTTTRACTHTPSFSPHTKDLLQNFCIVQLSACFSRERFWAACSTSAKEIPFCALRVLKFMQN